MTTMHAPARNHADLAAALTPPLTPTEIQHLTDPLTREEKRRLVDTLDVDGILADPKLSQSDRVLRTLFGSLRALGYDPAWLAAVTGMTVTEIAPPRRAVVPVDRMRLALTVAARIGDRPATPDSTGQTWEQIDAVKAEARRSHYSVPACYDERYNYVTGEDDDGNVWGSSRELARFAADSQSATVANKIRAVAWFLRYGGTARTISDRFGFTPRTWQRITKELDIKVARTGGGPSTVVAPAPGQDALRKAAVDAANALELGEDALYVWTLLCADVEALRAVEQADPAEQADLTEQAAA